MKTYEPHRGTQDAPQSTIGYSVGNCATSKRKCKEGTFKCKYGGLVFWCALSCVPRMPCICVYLRYGALSLFQHRDVQPRASKTQQKRNMRVSVDSCFFSNFFSKKISVSPKLCIQSYCEHRATLNSSNVLYNSMMLGVSRF